MKTLPTRRWGTAAALTALAVTLSACNNTTTTSGPATSGATGTGTPTATSGPINIGCTIPTFSHPFFVAMKRGLEDEAQKAGASINVVDGRDDAQAQLQAIDTFVVQRVNAIILCPTESEALPPGVDKASSQNIPVITVNRTVEGGKAVTYVGADDTDGGKLQGQAVIEALPKGGKIALLQGVLGSSPQRNREAGLEAALQGKAQYQIVEKIPYKFQRALAVSAVETLLNAKPKGTIDAIVAQSDDGALAAADVCGQKGRTEIKIIGFNGESDAFDYINGGKIHATILQDAETQGREAVKATLKHLKGEKIQGDQITPLYLVTKKNIGEHKPAWQSTKS